MSSNCEQRAADLAGADPARRQAAADWFSRQGESAATACVVLARASGDDDEAFRELVVAALEGCGPPPVSDCPQLAQLLQRSDEQPAYWAATLLGRLGPAARSAADALADAVRAHPRPVVRQRAAWALAALGPLSPQVRSILEQAAGSDDPRLARLARKALER